MHPSRWALCLPLICLATASFAQSTTGTISGRVIDAQDLPVPGVTVTADVAEPAGRSRRPSRPRTATTSSTLLPSGQPTPSRSS